MPSELKQMMVAELTERFGELSDVAFVDYSGLDAQQMRDLRVKLHQADSRLFVVKNRLSQRVITDDLQRLGPELFEGPTAAAYGEGDTSAMLKTLLDWGKDNRPVPLKGGLVDGEPMTAEQLAEVAKLPSRDALRAQLLATINAPMTTLLRLLNEPRRRMVAILDQKQDGTQDADSSADAESSEA